MLRLLTILALALISLKTGATPMPKNIDDAICMLDSLLDIRDRSANRKKASIDSIKITLKGKNQIPAETLEQLGDLYRRINLDSAISCYKKALAIIPDAKANRIRMKISALLPVKGMIHEAIAMREAIDHDSISEADAVLYYDSGFDLYQYIVAFYPEGAERDSYLAKSYSCNDSLLKYLPRESPHHKYHSAVKHFADKDYTATIASLSDAMGQLDFSDNLFARATNLMSQCYGTTGRKNETLFYLTLSAASDIAAGTKEATSLQNLSNELSDRGDVDRAYRYLMAALDNSIESGSGIRTLESARALPIIAKSFDLKDSQSHRLLIVLIGILSATIIACIALLAFNYRSRKKMQRLQTDLANSNATKDKYITQVLALCSSYVDQLEDFNRLAVRKIKAGQVQDFYEMAESGKILQSKTEKFLANFDEAFLSIYPGFVDKLNRLFLPDRQITPPSPKSLTPEIRILAFMRLGIDDCARIAKFLGLSVNTVYTYRNKLKSRAADRDNFETDIMKIGNFNLK